MELVLAIVSVIGTVVVAVIARLPGVTSTERQRASLKADLELIRMLPADLQREPSEAAHAAVKAFLEKRDKGKDWDRLPLLALAMILAAMGLFGLADAAAGRSLELAALVSNLLLGIAVAFVVGAVVFELVYIVGLLIRAWRWASRRADAVGLRHTKGRRERRRVEG